MGKVISKDGTVTAFDKLGEGVAIIPVSGAFTVRAQPTIFDSVLVVLPPYAGPSGQKNSGGYSRLLLPGSGRQEHSDSDQMGRGGQARDHDHAGGTSVVADIQPGAIPDSRCAGYMDGENIPNDRH